eukprot:5350377-Pleurochrysis_carterae.AAC.1
MPSAHTRPPAAPATADSSEGLRKPCTRHCPTRRSEVRHCCPRPAQALPVPGLVVESNSPRPRVRKGMHVRNVFPLPLHCPCQGQVNSQSQQHGHNVYEQAEFQTLCIAHRIFSSSAPPPASATPATNMSTSASCCRFGQSAFPCETSQTYLAASAPGEVSETKTASSMSPAQPAAAGCL